MTWHNRRHNLCWQSMHTILSFPMVGEKVQTCFCKYYLGPVQTLPAYWCGGTVGAMQFSCNSGTILLMSGNSESSSWLLIATLASVQAGKVPGFLQMESWDPGDVVGVSDDPRHLIFWKHHSALILKSMCVRCFWRLFPLHPTSDI